MLKRFPPNSSASVSIKRVDKCENHIVRQKWIGKAKTHAKPMQGKSESCTVLVS